MQGNNTTTQIFFTDEGNLYGGGWQKKLPITRRGAIFIAAFVKKTTPRDVATFRGSCLKTIVPEKGTSRRGYLNLITSRKTRFSRAVLLRESLLKIINKTVLKLVLGVYMAKIDVALFVVVLLEMEAYIDIFSFGVAYKVLCHINRTGAVTM